MLFGIGIARTGVVARWLGWIGGIGGLAYMASGVAVGYSGFENGFESGAGAVSQVLLMVFVVGMLVAGLRMKDLADPAGSR